MILWYFSYQLFNIKHVYHHPINILFKAESDTENDTGDGDGEGEEFSLPDTYRGLVDASTKCFVQSHTQDIVISQPDGSTDR